MSILHALNISKVVSRLLRAAQFGVLIYLIWLIAAPPPILVTLGAHLPVQAVHPKVGIHTRLTDEVEEWKIQKTLQMVREMGASWIVEYFPWDYIEHQPGNFDWGHAEQVVSHAQAQGLTVVARLGYVPKWARPKDSVSSYLDAAHYADYARFVAAFAAHFRGRVNYLIIWNEPNTNFEWGERPVSPNEYAALLKSVYPLVREKNTDVKILGGALAPNLASPGATDTMNDLEYLYQMYQAGAGEYFDILAVHAYGWQAAADQPPSPDVVNWRRTELLHEIMVQHGDGEKHVMITEGGWNDFPRWTKAVPPPARISDTLAAYNWCERMEWVDACALWAFRYPLPTYTFNDYWTFVTPDFDAKPIYLEVQKYARGQ